MTTQQDVDALLRTMNFKTKIGQLSQVDIALMTNDDKTALRQDLVDHYIGELAIGSVLNVPSDLAPWTAQDYRQAMEMIQNSAKRHGLPPVIWGLDSVHGANYVHGSLVSPQPINIAATFDPEHARKAGAMASRDTRRAGINWLFSPLLGIAWEPKWSRVYETFGEDPLVVGEMALAMTRGIQQPDDETVDDITASPSSSNATAIIPSKAAACAKHFLGYSMPHNGHDRSPSWIPKRHLFQYFYPPWEKVAGEVETVMESYTEIAGVPNVANRFTLNAILRHRLGFDKVLVTDYSEIYNLHEWHGTASNNTEAVLQSMREGTVDMSMIPWDADTYLQALTTYKDNHRLSEQRIDTSVRRVVELKHRLGMFDEEITKDNVDFVGPSEQDMADVMEMTRQSIILVKNDGDTLPLNASDSLKVLVTGPTSNSLSYQTGGWTWKWQGIDPADESRWYTYGSTVLTAVQDSDKHKWDISYTCGVDIMGGECNNGEDDAGQKADGDKSGNVLDKVKGWVGWDGDDPISYATIDRAITAAKGQDVVVICVGEESYTEKPGDIRSPRLPQGQYALVEAIRSNSDAKIVLVYFGGRPRLLEDMVDNVDAVLLGFLPGPMAGDALVETLTGANNPSAKLPITYPKYEDAAGSPYMHSVSDKCTQDTGMPLPHYNYVPCEVQWPFGHGLSYTQFGYHNLSVAPGIIHHQTGGDSDGTLDVSVTVVNTGSIAGYETVMVFSFDDYRSTTPEYKRLRGFEKVFLEPAESKEVQISIPVSDFKFVGPHDDTHFLYEPMQFRIGVGSSTDCRMNQQDGVAHLCSGPIALTVDEDYVGACESACDIWKNSGCMQSADLSPQSCMESCSAIHRDTLLQMNNDGWGYNYVECLESLVWNNDFHADTSQCWKMTTFCRDIQVTPDMDALGHGQTPSRFLRDCPYTIAALVLAVIAGVFITAGVIHATRGGFAKKPDEYGDVQFTGLPTGTEVD